MISSPTQLRWTGRSRGGYSAGTATRVYIREEERLNRNRSEVPQRRGDHLMDCWRYSEQLIERLWGRFYRRGGVRPPTSIRTEVLV